MESDLTIFLPPDDPRRKLAIARPGADSDKPHVSIAGDTYTVLISGKDTMGRFTVIDMHVPPGGGPPPHRHDFEETFSVLEGEIEFTFRGASERARAGDAVNIPANAPHSFTNASNAPARMLCICAPAGQEEFFRAVGDPVPTRTSPPPKLSEAEKAERAQRAKALMPQYRTELV